MKEAHDRTVVEVVDSVPEIRQDSAKEPGGGTKSAGQLVYQAVMAEKRAEAKAKKAASAKKKKTTRSKARSGSEKLTPAALYRKMIAFGKIYQVEKEQDFIEAARIYAEEAALIDQMRDKIAEDGLTVEKSYKTGSVEVAHPLLSELPRHVESANKCLGTIGNMIGERGARVEKAVRELDAFRLHVR